MVDIDLLSHGGFLYLEKVNLNVIYIYEIAFPNWRALNYFVDSNDLRISDS